MSAILPINMDDLLSARAVESARIECKKTWNEGPVGAQVLRTICAFANDFQNLNGGYAAIGVSAVDGVVRRPVGGLDPSSLEGIQSGFADGAIRWTPYTGDRRALRRASGRRP